MLADTDGNQRADVVGFDEDGAMISLRGASSFSTPLLRKHSFGVNAGGWAFRIATRVRWATLTATEKLI
jgi:hypothetical protein